VNDRTIILIVVLVILTLLVLYTIITYNKLKKLKNEFETEWSKIEAELKRKFDLIPNILEIIKKHASHENNILKGIIESRNKWNVSSTPIQKMEASNQLTNAIKNLMMITQNYPNLKENAHFFSIRETIMDIEDKLSISVSLYNNTVINFNNRINRLPSSIIAKIFKFKYADFFKVEFESKELEK